MSPLLRRALARIGLAGSLLSAPLVALLALLIRLESRGHPLYTQPRRPDGAPFAIFKLRTMVQGAEWIGAGLAIARGRRADHADRGDFCAGTRSTSCRTCGTSFAARCRSSARGRRSSSRSRSTPRASAAGWPSSRGSPAGPRSTACLAALVRADRARPLVRRAPLARARPEDPRPHGRARAQGHGLYKGETGGWHGPRSRRARRPAPRSVLLTGVGKRYDIVSAFAQHATVVAADPNPLAPAQYAAHHRYAVPPIDDPGYVPALAELCERHGVGAVVPLTDLDLEVLAHARVAGRPSRTRPRPRDRPRDVRQVRGPPAARAPRAALAADGASRRAGRRASR